MVKEKNLIDKYLDKYYQEMRDMEGVVEKDMGGKRKREEDDEQMQSKRAKPVSIFVKSYQTLSNILKP